MANVNGNQNLAQTHQGVQILPHQPTLVYCRLSEKQMAVGSLVLHRLVIFG